MDIKTKFDEFKKNSDRFIRKKKDQLESKITFIEQKSKDTTSVNTERIGEITQKIDELKLRKRELIVKNLANIDRQIQAVSLRLVSNPTDSGLLAEKDRLGRDKNTLQKNKINSLDEKIEPLESDKMKLTTSQRSIQKQKDSFGKLLTQKQTEQKDTLEILKKLILSMGLTYPLINRVNNLFSVMKKKRDEMDKKKSNNRLLQAMQNDMLYKEISALFTVSSPEKSKYKLKIERDPSAFKKRIPVLKKYFEGKNKFYENRGSILSALSLNINSLASAFTNNSPKNISYNRKSLNELVPNSTPQMVTTFNRNQPYTQPMFGRPSQPSYSPYQTRSLPMGYGQGGGASEIKQPLTAEKKPTSSYEFITILDKVFEDLKTKVRSNEVYENRLKLFINFLDKRDRELNKEILIKLQRVEKISKPEYQFLFPAQIRFITRRILRIQEFMSKLKSSNTTQMKHVYMTDFILMYFSMHYILSNFLDFILKPDKIKEVNS